jgi:uncharacterized SAM-binding protein YcdF (DUF218 family)
MRSPSTPDGAPRADAIVVLGCRARSRLAPRVERGVELFRQRAAPLLLLSGGGGGAEPEAMVMRRLALDHAVPEAALLVEPVSRNTWENARESARLLRRLGRRRVVLVSDRIHLPRAALLFRLAGVEIAARAGVRPASPIYELAALLREAAALPMSLYRALRRRAVRG